MEAMSYCRVSTEEQVKEGVSLAAQEVRVRAYCAVAGLSLIDNIRDGGSPPLDHWPPDPVGRRCCGRWRDTRRSMWWW